MTTAIDTLIGDFQGFFSDLLTRMKFAGLDITNRPISHLLYRTASIDEYETLRDKLKSYCSGFVETQHKGRAISLQILKEPLMLEDGHHVSAIELPSPKPNKPCDNGLESVGIIMGDELPEFIAQHCDALTDIKNQSQLASITFDNNKTVKFYMQSLEETVISQGWVIDKPL
jgi:predicted metalloenzyme YecM